MSNTPPSRTEQADTRAVVTIWWRGTGEPLVLQMLIGLTITVPLLVLLELLSWHQALRAMLVLGWCAGLLLIPRLGALLRHQRAREVAAGCVVVAALIFAAVGTQAAEQTGALLPVSAPELLAVNLQQEESITFVAQPRISKTAFVRLLQRGNGGGPSPAASAGEELYDIIVSYGLDPAVTLAFFAHESQMGTTGVTNSQDLHNWGGQRGAYNGQRLAGKIYVDGKPFVRFASWQDGLRDWCELILNSYVKRGLDTVAEAVPVYAPSSDNNVPEAYINTIHRMVAAWQGRTPPPPANIPHIYSDDLPVALLTETFLAAGVDYHPTWAFHRYAMDEAKAGRPLGSPLGDSRRITVGSKQFVVQAFALDTLYTPLDDVESKTNWGDVRRLSQMLSPQALTEQQAPPAPTATAVPAPAQQSSFQPQ